MKTTRKNFNALLLIVAFAPGLLVADPFPVAPPLLQPIAPIRGNCRATDLIGAKVAGRQGQEVGKLSDIVFAMSNGTIPFAVITTLEDERKIAVPAGLLRPQTNGNTLTLSCTEQHFRAAADFSKSDLRDPGWAAADNSFFHAAEPIRQMAAGAVISEPAGASRGGASSGTNPAPSVLVRSSDFVGMSVRDKRGQPVGEIKDVVIDWRANRILFAVLDPGSVSGLGNRFIAIAPSALTPTAVGGGLIMARNKEELLSAPGFDRAQWPGGSDGGFAAAVNHFYNKIP